MTEGLITHQEEDNFWKNPGRWTSKIWKTLFLIGATGLITVSLL